MSRRSRAALISGARRIDIGGPVEPGNPDPDFKLVVAPAINNVGAQLRRVDGTRAKLAGICVWGLSDIVTTTKGTEQYNNRVQVINTIKNWGANHIRFRILANNANNADDVAKLKQWVDLASAAGLYSSICWWDPLDGYAEDANWPTRYASAFPQMQAVVAALGPNNPYVFYEPFNEPNSFGAWGSNAQWDQWLPAMRATLDHFRNTCGYKGVLAIDTIDWSHGWNDSYMTQLENHDATRTGMTQHNLMFCKHDYANEYPNPDVFDAGKWIADTGGNATDHVLYESEYGNYNGDPSTVHPSWSASISGYLGDAAWTARSNYAGATPFVFGNWWDANALTAADNITPTTWGTAARDFITKSNVVGLRPPAELEVPPAVPSSVTSVAGTDAAGNNTITVSWQPPTNTGGRVVAGYVPYRSNPDWYLGTPTASTARSMVLTNFPDGPFPAGTTYRTGVQTVYTDGTRSPLAYGADRTFTAPEVVEPPEPTTGFASVIKSIPGLTHYYPLNDVTKGEDVQGTLDADFIGSGVTFDGNGARFNGSETNGYLTIPHSNDFSVRGTGTDSMTIMFFLTISEWLNTTNGNEYLHWAGKGSGGSNNLEWGCRHYVDNRNGTATGQAPERQGRISMYYWAPDGGTGNGAYLNGGDPETTSEIMMIVRMDAGSANYIRVNNGTTIVNTQPINGGTNADLVIGGPYNGKVSLGKRLDNTGALMGRIRRFAVFNRDITDAQIATLAAARNQPEGIVSQPPPEPTFQMASLRSSTMESKRTSTNTFEKSVADSIHSEWVGDWMPTNTVAATVSGFATRAGTLPYTVAVYGIPNRDSGGGYSAGGFATRQAYLDWIQQLRIGSGTSKVWWILEPDALGHAGDATKFTAAARTERQETLRQAVNILKQNVNAKVYIDASVWVDPPAMAALLGPAGLSAADGFSCNVSNFEPTATCANWAELVLSSLGAAGTGKKYIIDTSRNRNGALSTNYPLSEPWWINDPTFGVRNWCNPPGRGVGAFPQKPADRPNCAAYLWIKKIGESDGTFPRAAENLTYATDAPAAGTWWEEWWDEFILNSQPRTYPAAGIVTTTNLGTTKPNPHNVGAGVLRAMPTAALTTADAAYNSTTGVWTITKNITDKVITGYPKFGASNLVLENCIIKSDPLRKPTAARWMADGEGFTNNTVRYCTIYGTFASYLINGIGPRGVISRFNDISRVTDAWRPSTTGGVANVATVVEGNYAHHLQFYAPDPTQAAVPALTAGGQTTVAPRAGQAYNRADLVHIEEDSITGVTVRGNTLNATWADDVTSTLPLPRDAAGALAVQNLSAVLLNGGRSLIIDRNWLDGGEYCLDNPDTAVTGAVTGNRFGRNMDSDNRATTDAAQFALMVSSPLLETTGNVFESNNAAVPRRGSTYSGQPPVTTTTTRLGACPPETGGGAAGVVTKFGTGTAVRFFVGGPLAGAIARPAGVSLMHASWKPAVGSTVSDSAIITAFANLKDGDHVEVLHESDVKERKGSYTPEQLVQALGTKDRFHASVVRLRNAGSIPKVLTVNTWAAYAVESRTTGGYFINRLNPVIHCDADILGLDMDGMVSRAGYFDFASKDLVGIRAALYTEGYSYPAGWSVPEFCMPLHQETDPTASGRIAWMREQVPRIIAGLPATSTLPKLGPPLGIMFFDFNNLEDDEALELPNEIAAWRELVQQYAP